MHWWARKIKANDHEVVLLHAKFIRPFVQTNKTDAADASAISTAVHQPGMRTVAAKTEDQQAKLALQRMRSLLIKFGTMQVNQLRGLLYEFNVSFWPGHLARYSCNASDRRPKSKKSSSRHFVRTCSTSA
jgi:transposase